MALVDDAERLARAAHAEQRRKGAGGAPYFTHLESVARRLRAAGHDDEVTLAAAYLHDLLEDQPAFADELRRAFPPEVVATVEVVTEPKLGPDGRKLPKPVRFEAYVRQLGATTAAAVRARAVSCADKIDNLESLLASERAGEQLLTQLSTRPGQHGHHVATLRGLYAPSVTPALLASLDGAAARLADYLATWLPGRAVAIAAAAHTGQLDRGGAPYILHPLRLMLRCETRDEQMVAVLHDVVEDTRWTLDALRDEGFSDGVLAALDALTRRDGESYDAFVERIAGVPLAARVKLLDLEDNMDLGRLPEVGDEDRARVEKYRRAHARLTAALAG
jgi:(p)ppGpp synthase/HD superfamily hydrolase